jgi:hypothetical protein
MIRIFVLVLAVITSACGGGGGGSPASSCDFVRGTVDWQDVNGATSGPAAAADGDLGTFASIYSLSGGSSIDATGQSFSGGTNAGVFLTPPDGFVPANITLNTYKNGTAANSGTGPALTVTNTESDPPTIYVSLNAALPFDQVEMVLNTGSGTSYHVFEFCGAATVR